MDKPIELSDAINPNEVRLFGKPISYWRASEIFMHEFGYESACEKLASLQVHFEEGDKPIKFYEINEIVCPFCEGATATWDKKRHEFKCPGCRCKFMLSAERLDDRNEHSRSRF